MDIIKRNIKPLLLALTFPLLGALYPLFNKPGIKTFSLVTDLDVATPFLKSFILPYIAWYPYVILILVYFFFKDKKSFMRTIVTLNICLLFAYSTFVVYQTTVPRPVLSGDDILTNLVRGIYSRDNPYNCFPSIHVIETYILMKAMMLSEAKTRLVNIFVQVLGALIIFSTLFVKQHVILDVVYGIVLVELVFNIVYRYRRANTLQFIRNIFPSLYSKEEAEA